MGPIPRGVHGGAHDGSLEVGDAPRLEVAEVDDVVHVLERVHLAPGDGDFDDDREGRKQFIHHRVAIWIFHSLADAEPALIHARRTMTASGWFSCSACTVTRPHAVIPAI